MSKSFFEYSTRSGFSSKREPGNFALIASFSLAMLLGLGALIVDVGLLYWNKEQGQNFAEAAALAAARELDGTPAGIINARNVAISIISDNDPADAFFFDPIDEIEFGLWDGTTFQPENNPLLIDMVRVNLKRSDSKGNSVSPILAGALTFFSASVPSSFNISGSAASALISNPIKEAPIFPVAGSSCGMTKLVGSIRTLACGREIVFGDDPDGNPADESAIDCPNSPGDCVVDRTGNHFTWTAGDSSTAFGNTEIVSLSNNLTLCLQGITVFCDPAEVFFNTTIGVQNGNRVDAFSHVAALFPSFLTLLGTVRVQIPIYELLDCSAVNPASFTASVIGFGTLEINDIQSIGGSKYIRATIECDVETQNPISSEAEDFGTFGIRAVLVE